VCVRVRACVCINLGSFFPGVENSRMRSNERFSFRYLTF